MLSIANILENPSNSPIWRDLINIALGILDGSEIDLKVTSAGSAISSVELAKLYEFRRDSGYFRAVPQGINETIGSLRTADDTVFVRPVENDSALIIVFYDHAGVLRGLIILSKLADPNAS